MFKYYHSRHPYSPYPWALALILLTRFLEVGQRGKVFLYSPEQIIQIHSIHSKMSNHLLKYINVLFHFILAPHSVLCGKYIEVFLLQGYLASWIFMEFHVQYIKLSSQKLQRQVPKSSL